MRTMIGLILVTVGGVGLFVALRHMYLGQDPGFNAGVGAAFSFVLGAGIEWFEKFVGAPKKRRRRKKLSA